MTADKVLPNFLVLGAQRAGTTWLDRVLRAHPEIYLPTRRKEVHYFDQHFDRGLDWYRRFFPTASEAPPRVGEITPRYLFDPAVPDRLAETLPEARLVAILRDPVDRLYSHYGLHVRDRGERRPFEVFAQQEPEAVARGRYAEQLERYRPWLADHRLLVLVFEEVTAEPATAFAALGRFLGVEVDRFSDPAGDPKVNAAFRPRFPRARAAARGFGAWLRRRDADGIVNAAKRLGVPALFGSRGPLPKLDPGIRACWTRHYAEDRRRLETLLGRPLDGWRGEAR